METILGICGAGGLGREVLELAKTINLKQRRWEKFIFIVKDEDVTEQINGIKVDTYQNVLKKYQGKLEITVAVGEPVIRERIFHELIRDGIGNATLVHPGVDIPETTKIGKGVTINMGNFISCNTVIEDNVYIQPHTNIGHDCVLEEGCIVSGFCNIAGGCHIGRYAYLGMSSCIKENVSIGNYTIVGMASAVYKDVQEELIVMGNPARAMKKNTDKKVFK